MILRRPYLAVLTALSVGLAACSDDPTAPRAAPAETASAPLQAASPGAQTIKDRWIVVFKSGVQDAPGLARGLAAAHGGTLHHTFEHVLKGFAATLPPAAVEALRGHPSVELVQADQMFYPSQLGSQSAPSWGLDRVDRRDRPLNGVYEWYRTGGGVRAYVIDTGIQTGHWDFGGRASVGFDALGGNGQDCNGHGTHVAGTIGGATYGVAKNVSLIAVRVFGCSGGAATSTIVAALDWVRFNHIKPAVVNMSLGGPADAVMDAAVNNLLAAGVPIVVAAGNENQNACNVSPARVSGVLTIAATNINDREAYFSNHGPCVDLYAPGEGIKSTWLNGGTHTISGTSMASPHVAGAVALFLEYNTTADAAKTHQIIIDNTTVYRLQYTDNTTNRIVFTQYPGNSVDRVAVHRFYNWNWGDHAYSIRPDEGWETGYMPEIPNYFYIPTQPTPGHTAFFYCWLSWRRDYALSADNYCGGSTNLGFIGYIATTQLPGTVPLYVMEKPGVDWFYTIDPAEYQSAQAHGWVPKGITGYVYTSP